MEDWEPVRPASLEGYFWIGKAKDGAAILGIFAINTANALYEASFLIRCFHHFPILHPHLVPRHYIFAGADTPSTFKPFCNT